MKLRRLHWWWRPFHFCGWDRMCRSIYTPWYLNVLFLEHDNGDSVRFDLSPPWVRRRNEAWANSLEWQNSRNRDGENDD